MTIKKLPFDGNSVLLDKITNDYCKLVDAGAEEIPANRLYNISCSAESAGVSRSARKAALKNIKSTQNSGFKKVAFDTRRIDYSERNPRTNLQYWTRSDPFIDSEDQVKINAFSRLVPPLMEIKTAFEGDQEYFKSFARELYDHVNRILRLDINDGDIYRPSLAYLEQLMFSRYRLAIDDILSMPENDLKDRILSKDEALMKRGIKIDKNRIKNSLINHREEVKQAQEPLVSIPKNGNGGLTQESIVNAIFGNNQLRREGEKTVERTITITIKDNVLDGD